MTLKIAVLAPMPIASARMATTLNPGDRSEQTGPVFQVLNR